jgi:hypothetical protein
MSDDHKVNEIGRWYEYLIYRDEMVKYLTEWMLTGRYDVSHTLEDKHHYFQYAYNKNLIKATPRNVYIDEWGIEILPKGRKILNKGETNEQ